GIEKNAEFRNWTQGSTFVTRCDYLSPLFNESAYSMAVEKLLGITVPERATQITGVDRLLRGQPIWINRLKGVGWIGVEGCLSLGVTGPLLRAAGLPWDLRKTEPYLGYETYDFDVPTDDGGDCWSRFVVRVAEMRESLRIISQVVDRIEQTPGRVMVDDPKIAWPAQLSIGSDGMGNSPAHVNKIMNGSM